VPFDRLRARLSERLGDGPTESFVDVVLSRLAGPADIAVWTYQDSSRPGKPVALDEFPSRIGDLSTDGQHLEWRPRRQQRCRGAPRLTSGADHERQLTVEEINSRQALAVYGYPGMGCPFARPRPLANVLEI
jgi:hypothetical protein